VLAAWASRYLPAADEATDELAQMASRP